MDTYAKAVNMLKKAITNAINKAIENGELPQAELPQFIIETPADRTHGDFATNAAMAGAKAFRMPPFKIAQAITANLDFEDTISLCEEVRYDAMFTFIYSKRVGTPAASMPDPYTREQKQKHFDRLTEVSNRISGEKHKEYEGKTLRVLVDGLTGRDEPLPLH